MIGRTCALRPAEFAVSLFCNRQIVDRGKAQRHQPVASNSQFSLPYERHQFVVVVPLVGKPDSDAVFVKGHNSLISRYSSSRAHLVSGTRDLFPAYRKFRAVTPVAIIV